MQPFGKNRIPNKYHPFKTEDISLEQDPTDVILARDAKIAKYAPRVLKSYLLTYLRNLQHTCAIKRVKKIRFIHDDYPMYQYRRQWKLFLQNKLKSVLIYDNRENGWEPLKKYSAFSNITQVLLRDNNLNKGLMRYLPGMVNLKCLDALINSDTPSNLLKKLNSMPRALSRLETLKIEWSYKEKEEENNIPFSCLAENPNVVKHLTHLSIDGIQEDFFLEHLSKDCRNLVFLSAKFSKTSQDEHCSYLKIFENFEKLESIKIFSDKLGSFINNFILPPSIKYVSVNLADQVDWDEVSKELLSTTENNFSKKWKNLTNLVTLKISTKHRHFERFHGLDFMELILKSVPNLINLEFDLQLPKRHEYYVDEKNPINLSQILLACRNYSDRLEEIKLTLPTQYPSSCPSVEGIYFPKLKLLQLQKSRILNTETLENLFKVIKKPLADENIVRILLEKFVVKHKDTLIPLLEVLKKSPRNSKIALKIEVRTPALRKLTLEDLIENMKKVPALQNVPLEIDISKYHDLEFDSWEVIRFLEEMFADVRFSEKYELEFQTADDNYSDEAWD